MARLPECPALEDLPARCGPSQRAEGTGHPLVEPRSLLRAAKVTGEIPHPHSALPPTHGKYQSRLKNGEHIGHH